MILMLRLLPIEMLVVYLNFMSFLLPSVVVLVLPLSSLTSVLLVLSATHNMCKNLHYLTCNYEHFIYIFVYYVFCATMYTFKLLQI